MVAATPDVAVIQDVQLLPCTTATGKSAVSVLVSWKNTGNKPIRAVHARIEATDSRGQLHSQSADEYCIFAMEDYGSPAKPGDTVTERAWDQGYVLIVDPRIPGFEKPTDVLVDLTRVEVL